MGCLTTPPAALTQGGLPRAIDPTVDLSTGESLAVLPVIQADPPKAISSVFKYPGGAAGGGQRPPRGWKPFQRVNSAELTI